MLEQAGWLVNDKRIERIWRREVPHKQPKRGRLWLSDGSCIRLRPEHRNHVWSYDFVEDRTHDGRKYRVLNVIDECTHECLAIRVARKLKAIDVIDVLSDLFILRGVPGHIRSDNGPEFVAKAVQEWITAVGAKTAYITHPATPSCASKALRQARFPLGADEDKARFYTNRAKWISPAPLLDQWIRFQGRQLPAQPQCAAWRLDRIGIAVSGFVLGWICYSIASNILTYLYTVPNEGR